MFVILTDGQVLPTDQVCQGCLMADQQGAPRLRQGKLCCGQMVHSPLTNIATTYQCQMGFRLAEISD